MDQVPMIRFPVLCPVCSREAMATHDLASIAAAMIRDTPIGLTCACHQAAWTAGAAEREQIRQYLAAVRYGWP